jgi:predicted metal-dependent phosphoesterase TrpH
MKQRDRKMDRKSTKIDMHIHTRGSDGWGEPEEIAQRAVEAGLDGLCLADHHLTHTAESLDVAHACRQAGLLVFHACEYSSAWGHMLVYGCNVEDLHLGFYAHPQTVIDKAVAAGGLCVLAHPYKGYRRSYGERWKQLTGYAGLEVANGQCAVQTSYHNQRAKAATQGVGFGGSDAHNPDYIGACYTQFEGAIETYAELLNAMRNPKSYKAITAQKLVKKLKERRAVAWKPSKSGTVMALPGIDLDRKPRTVQIPQDADAFWNIWDEAEADPDPNVH